MIQKRGLSLSNLGIVLVVFLSLILLVGGASYIYTLTSSSSSTEAIYFNRTSILNGTGLGLDAPVLFMDFNTPPENNTDGNVTYVKDNSLYNSWGTLRP